MTPLDELRVRPEGRDPETTEIVADRVREGVREKDCPRVRMRLV